METVRKDQGFGVAETGMSANRDLMILLSQVLASGSFIYSLDEMTIGYNVLKQILQLQLLKNAKCRLHIPRRTQRGI